MAVLVIIGIAGWAAWWRAMRPVDRPLVRLSVDLGRMQSLVNSLLAAISPGWHFPPRVRWTAAGVQRT
jgi:hypothetical protein